MSTHRTPPITSRDHVLGDDTALVTLIEYGDFQCPYCGAAYPVLQRVRERLGSRLRFVFRHFPISENHPNALHAAQASESVAEQGGPRAFWAMHDLIFENQQQLDDRSLAGYAGMTGVSAEKVLEDLAAERYLDLVKESFNGGVRSGVNGTPTLFIDGIRYDGPRDEETLVAALELVAAEAARA